MNTTVDEAAAQSQATQPSPDGNIWFMFASVLVTQVATLIIQVVQRVKKSKCASSEIEFRSSSSIRGDAKSGRDTPAEHQNAGEV